MSIVIIGATGSGKSSIGNLIASELNYKVIEIGNIVKEIFQSNNSDIHTSNFSQIEIKKARLEFVDVINKKYGNDFFVKEALKENRCSKIVLVGPRTISEMNYIKQVLKEPFFVGIVCSDIDLEKRFISREQKQLNYVESKELFKIRRQIEKSWELNKVIEQCDCKVYAGNHDVQTLVSQILEVYNNKF